MMSSISTRLILVFGYMLTIIFFAKAQNPDRVVDSLKQLLQKSKPDSVRFNLLFDIGYTLLAYDPEAALPYGHESMALARKLKFEFGRGEAAYMLFNINLNLGEYNSAGMLLDTAETIFVKANRHDKIARVYNGRGNLSYMQGDLYAAAEYFTKASEQFNLIKDTTNEIIAYQNLIATLSETRNYEKANKMSRQLLNVLLHSKDTLQAARAWHNLILNNLSLGKLDSARPYIFQLHNFIQHSNDLNLVAESYHAIGKYYDYQHKNDSALYCFNMAIKKAIRQNYQPSMYYLSIGAIYLKMNQLDLALGYLSVADSFANAANAADVSNNIRRQLAMYYAQTGAYRLAYENMKQYSEVNDSLLSAETRAYAARMETVYETGKKEEEIVRLKQTELEKSMALRQRSTWIAILGILSIATLLIIFLLWRNQQIKKRLFEQQNALQQQKISALESEKQNIALQAMISGQEAERVRIAQDLHDGLGGIFSTVKMYFSSLGNKQPSISEEELFKKSVEMIDLASTEVRRIAHNLMPEILKKYGLLKAVEELCNQMNRGGLIDFSLQAYNMPVSLGSSNEIMLYRILQELLNNILKHAEATKVIVQFNQHEDKLSVIVEDNGKGFDHTENEGRVSAGLETIKSRVSYLNGTISIESKESIGTTIMMEFFLPETNKAIIA